MSITITDVTYSFKAKPVLSDINLSLKPGFNVLLGPNGAGKSTLLSLLTGQRKIQQGKITFTDFDKRKRIL